VIAGLPRLHAVTDDRVIGEGRVVERAAALAEAAGSSLAVHLRSLVLDGRAFLELARDLARVLAPHGAWLAINGRADVARAASARLVVSGRGGLSPADVRRVVPRALVARSVHEVRELRRAEEEGADIAIVSKGCPMETRLTVIAIGGITPERVPEALAAGAWGVAAIRALWDADNVGAAAGAFLASLPRDATVGVMINGAPRRARQGASLAGLLGDLGLDARAVVVEHNQRIVRRDGLDAAVVHEGDAIELVHFVGGG
jgi:thiamine biosynthesis protein ThiS